jgi:hypothetical protein
MRTNPDSPVIPHPPAARPRRARMLGGLGVLARIPLLPTARGRRAAIALATIALLVRMSAAAPGEDAFIRIWGIHRQSMDDHEAVAAACREAIVRRGSGESPALGHYLPVVRTVEGWRLLQLGRTAEAAAAFEAALDPARSSEPLVHAADALARRWLSRIDREAVAAALKDYHREHVAYPDALAVFSAWPAATRPPLLDRMGDPWSYRLAGFQRLKVGGEQRYNLYSRAIGRETSSLEAARALRQPDLPITFVRKNTGAPALAEFRIGGGTNRLVVVQEGARSGGLRFVALDGQGRFALLCDDDFWLTALPSTGGRR